MFIINCRAHFLRLFILVVQRLIGDHLRYDKPCSVRMAHGTVDRIGNAGKRGSSEPVLNGNAADVPHVCAFPGSHAVLLH